MAKKHLVGREPFKKDSCVICGKRLDPKYADVGIGDRCYKAAKKRYPGLFGEDGKIVKERVTEDIRLDLMEFMRGDPPSGNENLPRKRVCYCAEIPEDEDPADALQAADDLLEECACRDDEK